MTDTTLTPPPAGPPLHALLTAGVLLLLYVGLTVAMMGYFAASEGKLWEHALLIYNGFTAFAVAAGGVLLGTQIQQANVTAARREATEAKSEADRVKQAARAALAATHAPSAAAGAAPLADVRDLLTKAI
ncbi:hypothetical protein [Phenylobacterium sp.]|uniref:hypothetical protein n=1 Tax=Phenylobacterium sp. TaxID=1871053 RepID=UPI00271DC098|nr:hypothetical protein [Phenylobacterium sp.]MDO8377995.1 hypothetical protein [Phenylobacterium sp.]